jgi:hypothetical protein
MVVHATSRTRAIVTDVGIIVVNNRCIKPYAGFAHFGFERNGE